MSYFDGMIPCGILDHGITSLKELTNREIDNDLIISILILRRNMGIGPQFHRVFKQ